MAIIFILCAGLVESIYAEGGPEAMKLPAAAHQAREYDFSEVDRLLRTSLPEVGGGCSLVLIKEGSVIYRRAFGTAALDSAVPVGAASQWLSAGVIMALVDEGAIGLDDRVSDYLPQFSGAKGAINVRHLLSQTGGFPHRLRRYRDSSLSMEEAVAIIAREPLAVDPGTEYIRSDAGLQVAGRIAELATGERWVDLFTEKIGGPLGMRRTSYYAFGETENPVVAGGIGTSADDYARFLWMLVDNGRFNGTRILSVASVREMLKNQTDTLPIRRIPGDDFSGEFDEAPGARPGFGCRLEGWDRRSGNAWEASSGGAFGARAWIDLKRKTAGVFLAFNRELRIDEDGVPYNEASAVFIELKRIIDGIVAVEIPDSTASRPPAEGGGERRVPPGGRGADTPFQLARQMLQRNDKDGDKMLSRSETPQRLAPAFNRIDRDKDGKLNIREIVQALRVLAKLRTTNQK